MLQVHNTKLKSKNTPTGRALELATAPASHIVDAFNKGKLPAPPSKLHPLLKEKLLVGLYPQEYFNKIQNQDISSLEGSKIKELDEQYAQTTKP